MSRRDFHSAATCPLRPNSFGKAPSKTCVIESIRRVLQQARILIARTDQDDGVHQRFSGHSMRVAGAQFLSAAGVPKGRVQLLGRWSSTAVDRYTQTAALQVTPQVSPRLWLQRGRAFQPHQWLPLQLWADRDDQQRLRRQDPVLNQRLRHRRRMWLVSSGQRATPSINWYSVLVKIWQR